MQREKTGKVIWINEGFQKKPHKIVTVSQSLSAGETGSDFVVALDIATE